MEHIISGNWNNWIYLFTMDLNMKLDDSFSIKTESGNIVLIELVDGFKWTDKKRTKKVPSRTPKEHYYGTLYQALQGYIGLSTHKADTLKDIRKIALKTISTIDQLEEDIKKTFCIYVKTTK